MSQYVAGGGVTVEIESREQLLDLFEASCKPRPQWRIGTEYEKVVVRAEDGRAAPFSGPRGIEALLKRLAERYPWEAVIEEGRVVALRGAKAWITLEPGGQIELSGEVCDTIHCNYAEFQRHVREMVTVGNELGLACLGLAMQPISRIDEIEWVPKARYRIMAPYMTRVGTLGHRMMKQSAGIQVNLDYSSEADAMEKCRVGLGLVPLFTAMFANSPFSDADLNGYLCYRGHIWTDTDSDRCGLLPLLLRPEASFERYVELALDVPMYFIVRDEMWHDMTAFTFRRYLEDGYDGHRATMEDWISHLTTLFYEVRLKSVIEIRCVDAQMPDLTLAVPALVKGIFYEQDCLLAAWDLVKGWNWEERVRIYNDAHRGGLQARVGRFRLVDLARELITIATTGLERQRCLNRHGEDESLYLERLADLLRHGACPAERVVEQWKSGWAQDPAALVAGTSYRAALGEGGLLARAGVGR